MIYVGLVPVNIGLSPADIGVDSLDDCLVSPDLIEVGSVGIRSRGLWQDWHSGELNSKAIVMNIVAWVKWEGSQRMRSLSMNGRISPTRNRKVS